jgi:hypothetical protein
MREPGKVTALEGRKSSRLRRRFGPGDRVSRKSGGSVRRGSLDHCKRIGRLAGSYAAPAG